MPLVKPGLKNYTLLSLGKNLRHIRLEKKLTQAVLAERCGMQKASISRIEAGKINVTISTLICLATALETELENLFRDVPLLSK